MPVTVMPNSDGSQHEDIIHMISFLTSKVPVVGSGVGVVGIDVGDVGVTTTPSCEQVVFSPVCVHIRFAPP